MKKHINKKPVSKKLNKKRVEDGILTYLKTGIITTDMGFGELTVKFQDIHQLNHGLNFRKFNINDVHYELAAKDEKHLTLTYLFH